MKRTIGDRLKEARKLRGNMTRRDLSGLSGVPYSTLADLENGGQKTTTQILELAAALKVRAEWLRSEDGPMDEHTAETLPANQEIQEIIRALMGLFTLVAVERPAESGRLAETIRQASKDGMHLRPGVLKLLVGVLDKGAAAARRKRPG